MKRKENAQIPAPQLITSIKAAVAERTSGKWTTAVPV